MRELDSPIIGPGGPLLSSPASLGGIGFIYDPLSEICIKEKAKIH
jgi:hypothetical protein